MSRIGQVRAPANLEQEVALGIHDFLWEADERFRLHSVLHFGWSSLAVEGDVPLSVKDDAGWVSCMRPRRYVEVYVQLDDVPRAVVRHFRTKDFEQVAHAANSSFDYGVAANVCRCEICRGRYPNPYAQTIDTECDVVDLAVPDALELVRRKVLTLRWL